MEELERHFTLEPWVPGAPDLAVGAGPGQLEDGQVAPLDGAEPLARGFTTLSRGKVGRGDRRVNLPVRMGNLFDVAQSSDPGLFRLGGPARPCELPIDGLTIGDRACDLVERIVSAHCP